MVVNEESNRAQILSDYKLSSYEKFKYLIGCG